MDVVTKKLLNYGWEVLPHEPYSPDMSPPDFDLYAKLKDTMRRQLFCFFLVEELSTDVTRAIRHMNKSGVLGGG